MSYHAIGPEGLEYYPCRYGASRILFRGPRRSLNGNYIAFLGGTETYGRFIATPFPTLLEKKLSVASANFGIVNAGVDLYLNDPAVLELSATATIKVIQIMGAQNMSNRYYTVHPRRNDRFLKASEKLESLYPDIDFTEFHFNRHMLAQLKETSEERFAQVVDELQHAWMARMKHLLTVLRGSTLLVWFSNKSAPLQVDYDITGDPLFITKSMLEELRPRATDLIEIKLSESALLEGTQGMVFSEYDACAAEELLGQMAHNEAADRMGKTLQSILERPKK